MLSIATKRLLQSSHCTSTSQVSKWQQSALTRNCENRHSLFLPHFSRSYAQTASRPTRSSPSSFSRNGPKSSSSRTPATFRAKPKSKLRTEQPTTPLTGDLVKRLETALLAPKPDPEAVDLTGVEERVAKRIARCGLCSRRVAEKWIMMGRVKIDGKIVDSLGASVRPGQLLEVDDIPIRAEPPKLFLFNKVRNMLITRSEADAKGRDTLGQLLAEMGEPTLLPVGRLDFTSEGLLLLTNDGELKRYLEHPDSQIIRVYRVRVYGRVQQSKFDGLEKGITVDGFHYKGVKVTVERASERKGPSPAPQRGVLKSGNPIPSPETRANTWIRVELQEGKNREIRKIMEHLGLEVSRLIRVQYGPYKLTSDIESGVVKSIHILPELKAHTNLHWNWHSRAENQRDEQTDEDGVEMGERSSPSDKLKMPKSNPPPNRKGERKTVLRRNATNARRNLEKSEEEL